MAVFSHPYTVDDLTGILLSIACQVQIDHGGFQLGAFAFTVQLKRLNGFVDQGV
jgi:hypothetical protein